MFNKLKTLLLKKLILDQWAKKTADWKMDDWINYVHGTFDMFKKTEWTKKVFPEIENLNYDDLVNYRVIDEFPDYPPDYPKYLEWWSSGTVKKKVIRLSKKDSIMISRSLGRFTYNISRARFRNILGITSVPPFATANLIKFSLPLLSKRYMVVKIYEIEENIERIIKNAKYDGFVTLTGFLSPLLDKVIAKYDIFHENLAIGLTGDVLIDSVVKKLENYLRKWISRYNIYNFYACAEAGIMAISDRDYHNLIYYPDSNGIMVLTEKGNLIDIFRAKKGVVGEVVLTIFRELLIPNYNLHDIIKITGRDPKTGLPTFSVLGKKVRKVMMDLPDFGEIRGESGAVLRVAGAPLNTKDFDAILAELGVEYLVIIDDYRMKANFTIYTDRKIDEGTFLEKLRKCYIMNIWAEKYNLGIVNFEFITDREMIEKYRNFIIEVTREKRSPKIPRIIVRRHDWSVS